MPIDPARYSWLDHLGQLPRMISEARALIGTHELAGPADNPAILAWASEVGGDVASHYSHDSVPWCGLFMAVVAKRAGKTPPADPLWALNWSTFGQPAGQPMLGDVLTFLRRTDDGTAGHVGLYVAEDPSAFHVLGGNQSDQVCFTRIGKDRLHAARRPIYVNRPATVRPFLVAAIGELAGNHAMA